MSDTAPEPNKTMVRALYVAIALMTTAIVVILIAMMVKLASPGAPTTRGIDFAAAPEVEIGLPPGARVVETHVGADRVTLVIETARGEAQVFTAPLTGYDTPVRLVFRTLE